MGCPPAKLQAAMDKLEAANKEYKANQFVVLHCAEAYR